MDTRKSDPVRRLRFTYLTAIGTILILVVSSHLISHQMIVQSTADSTVINIAGRQRMLSQRIAKASYRLAMAQDPASRAAAYGQLDKALALWTSSHEGLLTRDESMGLGGSNSAEVEQSFASLSMDYDTVVSEATLLLAEIAPDSTGINLKASAHAETIVEAADRFLPVMNDIVFQYDDEATARIANLQQIEMVLGVVTVLLLILEVFLVFEPATRLIRRTLHESDELRVKAEAASRAKGDFLANMSHEIRTPMTAILGYLDLLQTDPKHRKDSMLRDQTLITVRRNADHLLQLINDILDMSKIEAGQMTVEQIPMDPMAVAEEAVSMTMPKAKEKDLAIRVEYPDRLPTRVTSDPTRVRQVLINLIGNAIKFTSKGSVTLRVNCDPETHVLSYAIADTGIGMTPEQLERVRTFEPFTQADASTTRHFGGTGLGLSISHALTRQLGGGLDVESTPGVGSTFVAKIEAGELEESSWRDVVLRETPPQDSAQQGESDRDVSSEAPPKPLHRMRILLAEDGPDNQRLFEYFLKAAGAEITIVANGRLACEYIEALPDGFDLVLMDMQMPELDGYAATRRIREGGHAIPVIALTAHAMAEDRRKCMDAGCDEFLTKPVNREKLILMCDKMGRPALSSIEHRL